MFSENEILWESLRLGTHRSEVGTLLFLDGLGCSYAVNKKCTIFVCYFYGDPRPMMMKV